MEINCNNTDTLGGSFSKFLFDAAHNFDKYYTPFLCLFGSVGNILSVIVFSSDTKYRNQSAPYYLSALAISDIGFLLNLFLLWLQDHQEGDILSSNILCPSIMYLGQVTCFISVYLVVAFSIERYVAVHFPLARQRICTPGKAKRIIYALVVVALILFSYVLVIAQVVEVETDGCLSENSSYSDPHYKVVRCSVPDKYHGFSEIANYLDSIVTFLLPFILITFSNMRIALCMWRVKSRQLNVQSTFKQTPEMDYMSEDSHTEGSKEKGGMDQCLAEAEAGEANCKRNSISEYSRHCPTTSEIRGTKTLLLISFIFLLLNFPAHLLRCAQFIQTITGFVTNTHEILQAAIPWTNILFNTNFAINFLLYCVSGRNFRKSLGSLLLCQICRKKKFSPSQSVMIASGKRRSNFSMSGIKLTVITGNGNGVGGSVREDEVENGIE